MHAVAKMAWNFQAATLNGKFEWPLSGIPKVRSGFRTARGFQLKAATANARSRRRVRLGRKKADRVGGRLKILAIPRAVPESERAASCRTMPQTGTANLHADKWGCAPIHQWESLLQNSHRSAAVGHAPSLGSGRRMTAGE